jgi:dolichol-phosphate mannosyltransferase
MLIIIPTFNEKNNIDTLIRQIFIQTKNLNVNILVVDDASPDGTASTVKILMDEEFKDKLFMLQRIGKLGLASAYINGFKWGLLKNYDILIEMDADLSHDPKYLPEIINKMENYDFIIGSRYVKGGGVSGWGPIRRFLSIGGSLYSRYLLKLPIKDLTGGFNFWKKEVIEGIGIESIISKGYLFQIELKYKAYKKNFKFMEFPIIFNDRKYGESKMDKKIFFEALMNIWKIKKL